MNSALILYTKKAAAYKKLQSESNQLHFMAREMITTNGNDGLMLQNAR
jgi:hypothetical protein